MSGDIRKIQTFKLASPWDYLQGMTLALEGDDLLGNEENNTNNMNPDNALYMKRHHFDKSC